MQLFALYETNIHFQRILRFNFEKWDFQHLSGVPKSDLFVNDQSQQSWNENTNKISSLFRKIYIKKEKFAANNNFQAFQGVRKYKIGKKSLKVEFCDTTTKFDPAILTKLNSFEYIHKKLFNENRWSRYIQNETQTCFEKLTPPPLLLHFALKWSTEKITC